MPIYNHTLHKDALHKDTVLKDSVLKNSVLKDSRIDSINDRHLNPQKSELHTKSASPSLIPVSLPVRLSFQLMTCAEPIDVVIASIESILAIKSADDEIVIVDNNNTKTALYQPLAKFCRDLDPNLNVHFYHIDAVVGFKAGALNLALGLMTPDATHIVVVDSDYQALPQARRVITAAIEDYPEHALLQFPQFYRDDNRLHIHSELNHYFNYHLYRSFNRERALSTGTYAVIRRDALLTLGGWSCESITEDAQMGILMHQHGLRSRFIPQVIATGLLPTSVGDLINQRKRWIYGNVQVLSRYLSVCTSPPIQTSHSTATDSIEEGSSFDNLKKRLSYVFAHLSQLSAWINFTGIFIVLHILALCIIVGALAIKADVALSYLLTPLYLVYAGYGLFLSRRLWAYIHDDAPLNHNNNEKPTLIRKLNTWALHLNFWEFGALSWVPVLLGYKKPFICTPKQQSIRTRYQNQRANIIALPKLLLLLNVITMLVAAPFSPLYAPVIFVAALTVTVLKLWAAKIMLSNYAYTPTSKPQSKAVIQELNKRAKGSDALIMRKLEQSRTIELFHTKAAPSNSPFKDDNVVNF